MSRRKLWIGGYGPRESAHGDGLGRSRSRRGRDRGEVEVEVTWNIMDEGRPNTDLFDLVEAGEMFMCYFSSSYLGDRVPELNVLETPFLFTDLAAAHRALDGELGQALARAVRATTGFEVLGFWDNGFRHMTNRLRPIAPPEDCRGMTVRLQPNAIHEELIRSWGAIPVAVRAQRRHPVDLASRGRRPGEPPGQHGGLWGRSGPSSRHHDRTSLRGERLFSSSRRGMTSSPICAPWCPSREIGHRRPAASRRALESTLRARLEDDGVEFVDLTDSERAVFVETSAPAIALAHRDLSEDLFELARI